MTYREICELFMDENPFFKEAFSDYRPGEKDNTIIVWLKIGEKIEATYDEERKRFYYSKEYGELMDIYERSIDYALYRLIDNLHEINHLYGRCDLWDKTKVIDNALEKLKEVNKSGYEKYVQDNETTNQ